MLLSNQLMEPLFDHRAVSLLVNVDSVCGAWLLSIDRHARPHGGFLRCRSHDKMKIAGVKAVCYPPVGLVQQGRLLLRRW